MSKMKTNATATIIIIMEQSCNAQAGSRNENQPRLVGEILQGMLSSNQPLARGYRAYLAATENAAEKGGLR